MLYALAAQGQLRRQGSTRSPSGSCRSPISSSSLGLFKSLHLQDLAYESPPFKPFTKPQSTDNTLLLTKQNLTENTGLYIF